MSMEFCTNCSGRGALTQSSKMYEGRAVPANVTAKGAFLCPECNGTGWVERVDPELERQRQKNEAHSIVTDAVVREPKPPVIVEEKFVADDEPDWMEE